MKKKLTKNNFPKFFRFELLFIILFLSCSTVPKLDKIDPYNNDLARFLAGLSVSQNSRFLSLTQTKSYINHKKSMDLFWSRVEKETINNIQTWQIDNIPSEYNKNTAFYPLSGADFINLYTLFPHSSEYIMVAMEKTGSIPDPLNSHKWRLNSMLANIQTGIRKYGQMNYFQSKVMRKNLNRTNLGITPVLLIFIARLDLNVLSIDNVKITNSGKIEIIEKKGDDKIKPNGIRITFFSKKKRSLQTLTYIRMKLSNNIISKSTPEGKFFNSLNKVKTIMKSAIYLLHMNGFDDVRNLILKKSSIIVQDDSGIPYKYFKKDTWNIKLYGVYIPNYPISGCRITKQYDLKNDFNLNSYPLPFHFGYGGLVGKNRSNLIIAVKK